MYKLYWRQRTGSFAPAAVMAELEIPYEAILLEKDGKNAAVLHEQNPMAQIPLLILPDGSAMTKSGAISLYLAETRPDSGLALRTDDPLRPHFLRWLSFVQVNLYETVLRYYYNERYTSDPAGAPGVRQAAAERIERLWDMVAEEIQGPFFFGNRFTVLDIYLAMLAAWHSDPSALYGRLPKVGALVEATVARPATGKVWHDYSMHKRTD